MSEQRVIYTAGVPGQGQATSQGDSIAHAVIVPQGDSVTPSVGPDGLTDRQRRFLDMALHFGYHPGPALDGRAERRQQQDPVEQRVALAIGQAMTHVRASVHELGRWERDSEAFRREQDAFRRGLSWLVVQGLAEDVAAGQEGEATGARVQARSRALELLGRYAGMTEERDKGGVTEVPGGVRIGTVILVSQQPRESVAVFRELVSHDHSTGDT